jgi:hypothetical protein
MTPLMKKLLTIGVATATLSAAPTSSHARDFGGIGAGIAAGIIGGIIASQVARPVYITPRVRVVRVRAPARRVTEREPTATPAPTVQRTAGPPKMD